MEKLNKTYEKLNRILLKGLYKEDTNLIVSPYSIMMALSMIMDMSAGKSKDEVKAFLDADDGFIEKLINEVNVSLTEEGFLKCANAVAIREDFKDKVRNDYKERFIKLFSGEIFSDENLVSLVNSFVNDSTDGMIDSVMDESMKDVVCAIINAICFNAGWEKEYEEKDITDGVFNNLDGSKVDVKMLKSIEYDYIETEKLTGFIKSYKGGHYAFLGLLPNKKGTKGIMEVLEGEDFSSLPEIAAGKVMVRFPEFKAEYGTDLKELFMNEGVKEVFGLGADFSPISAEPLYIDKLLHKAIIEVDRHGTRAAAVTAGMVMLGCAPGKPKEVTLDRPFVYAVVNLDTKLPVFTGVINQL